MTTEQRLSRIEEAIQTIATYIAYAEAREENVSGDQFQHNVNYVYRNIMAPLIPAPVEAAPTEQE